MKKQSLWKVFFNGILKENPVLVLLLGTCPTLAVTTQAVNGIGMGLAATVVLVGSNVAISLIKKLVPDSVRIPIYITVIAAFVTVVQMICEAYAYSVYQALGIFLPLIVVNCIILARAEMFASKNSVLASAVDGLGMGLGFTCVLLVMGSIREILGAGTWFGMPITNGAIDPMVFFMLPPGGFFVFGILVALVNHFGTKRGLKPRKSFDCDACPSKNACQNCQSCNKEA